MQALGDHANDVVQVVGSHRPDSGDAGFLERLLASLLHLVVANVVTWCDAFGLQGNDFLGAHVQRRAGIAFVDVIP